MTQKGFVPLSVDIERILTSVDVPELSILFSLRKTWSSIAGDLVAQKAFPSMFRNGVLTVTVCNHSWAQELQMNKPVLLSKILSASSSHAPITDMRFLVGNVPAPKEKPVTPQEGIAADSFAASEELSKISDPLLRERLRGVIRGMRITYENGGSGG